MASRKIDFTSEELTAWCPRMQCTPEQVEHERKILAAHDAVYRSVGPQELERTMAELRFLLANRSMKVILGLEDDRLCRLYDELRAAE